MDELIDSHITSTDEEDKRHKWKDGAPEVASGKKCIDNSKEGLKRTHQVTLEWRLQKSVDNDRNKSEDLWYHMQ